MTNENNSAEARQIPVPPGGGSWTFNEAEWKWVSNEPLPVNELVVQEPAAQTAEEK